MGVVLDFCLSDCGTIVEEKDEFVSSGSDDLESCVSVDSLSGLFLEDEYGFNCNYN